MDDRAFQDLIPHNDCFGCGPHNEGGLQIKSHWRGDVSVCRFTPGPHHKAGPSHILNGGIIATVIDCHTICTAIADAYRREGRAIGSDPPIWCATASLKLRYLRPTPIDLPVELIARVREADGKKTFLGCSLSSDGVECATAEVVAVRVPAKWSQTS